MVVPLGNCRQVQSSLLLKHMLRLKDWAMIVRPAAWTTWQNEVPGLSNFSYSWFSEYLVITNDAFDASLGQLFSCQKRFETFSNFSQLFRVFCRHCLYFCCLIHCHQKVKGKKRGLDLRASGATASVYHVNRSITSLCLCPSNTGTNNVELILL